MSLDLSFNRIRRPQCNLFRFHRHRSPGTIVTSALPPSVLHWPLAGHSDGTRAQLIVSHRASRFAGTAMIWPFGSYVAIPICVPQLQTGDRVLFACFNQLKILLHDVKINVLNCTWLFYGPGAYLSRDETSLCVSACAEGLSGLVL